MNFLILSQGPKPNFLDPTGCHRFCCYTYAGCRPVVMFNLYYCAGQRRSLLIFFVSCYLIEYARLHRKGGRFVFTLAHVL